MEFILNNWSELALAFITLAGTISALTSSSKDDTIVAVLSRILNAVILGKSKK